MIKLSDKSCKKQASIIFELLLLLLLLLCILLLLLLLLLFILEILLEFKNNDISHFGCKCFIHVCVIL